MRNKKFLASLMLATMLTDSVVPAFAEGLSSEGDTGTAQTGVSFSATSVKEPGEAIVSVPESLTLSFDDSTKKYSSSDSVYAYGDLDNLLQLEITSSATVRYENEDVQDAQQIFGKVEFVDDTYTGIWSSEDLKSGVDNQSNSKKIPIKCYINETKDMQIGTYKGKVNFKIKVSRDLDKIALYDTDTGVVLKGKTYDWDTSLFKCSDDSSHIAFTDEATTWLADPSHTTLPLISYTKVNDYGYMAESSYVGLDLLGSTTNYVNTVIFPEDTKGLNDSSHLFTEDTDNTNITTIYVPALSYINSGLTYNHLPNLTDFYYAGTANQFSNAILADSSTSNGTHGNTSLWSATIHVLDDDGNYVDFDKEAFIHDYPLTLYQYN